VKIRTYGAKLPAERKGRLLKGNTPLPPLLKRGGTDTIQMAFKPFYSPLSQREVSIVSPPFLEGRESEGRSSKLKKVPQRMGDLGGSVIVSPF
jgi:hypothetical protein